MAAPNSVTGENNIEFSGNLSIGAATTDYVGFYGVTPIVQRASASQAAVATAAITAPVTTAATSTNPFGFATAAQADAIQVAVNALITRVAAQTVLVNELRAAQVAVGLIKGSA